LDPDAFKAAVQWLEQQRALWAHRHDRLAEHLRSLQEPDPA
jgi:hypothetical protein